jgi:hypothetical protein
MPNIIKPKRSNTAAKIPNTTELTSGELGVNMADRKVYINNGTAVVQVGAGNLSGLGDVAVTSPANGQSLRYNSTTTKWENSAAGSGDVVGPASSTDNALVRFDGTTGKLIQNSLGLLDDSGNLDVTSAKADYFDLDTAATAPASAVGRTYWDDGTGASVLGLKGGNVDYYSGQQEFARVFNGSGAAMTKGQVVYIVGAQGNRLDVRLARANAESTSANTIGFVAEAIANGAEGWIQTTGPLPKLNTSTLTQGQVLYLSPTTAGAYTTTKPQAPDQLVVVGFVERVSATVGSIYIKVNNGYELDELHDVQITTPASGNTLIYNATTGVWRNANITAGSGVSVTNGAGSITIANSAPDQTVVLTGAGATTITGTYPNFTISSVNTTYSLATSTVLGLIELGSDTQQAVAPNAVSATASRSYALQVNAAGQGVVNVPWTDTNSGGTVTSVGGTGTVNGISLSGTVTSSGNLTLGGTLSGVSLTTQVSGTLPIANGGTGATTRQDAMDALAGAVTSGQYLRGNGTDVVMSTIQAADVPTLNQNTTGTAANVTGTVAVANGGTGATTAAAARTNLGATTLGGNIYTLANVAAISFPRFNADNTVSSLDAASFRTAIGAGTSSTTGTVTSVGGTGTVSGLTLTGTVTTSGNLTLGGTLAVTPSNFASQTANTVLAAPNGAAGVPTFRALVSGDIPTLNQNTTGTAANVTGTVAIANGGTGAITRQDAMDALAGAVTAGQYLRGNGTDVVMSAIQAADVPTLNQNTTGTSANVTGTVAVANGGTGATTAAGARANLGATTLGGNVFTVPNVAAISFPRFNADNTVSTLDAASFRTAIGAGTGNGTVTSVATSGTVSGLTLTGGTITTTGTITLGGTLAVTPSNFASQTANTVLAAPNGAAGVPTFRAIVAADIPTLNQSTSGNAATATTATNVSGGTASVTTLTVNSNNISAVNSLGFRNRIINGDMRIDQRSNGLSITPINGQYALDRYACSLSQAGKYSVQQNAGSVTPPAGFTNYFGVTSLSAYAVTGNDRFAIEQIIEGFNISDFNWGTSAAVPATLSFWVRSSLTGTFGGSIATTRTAIWVMPFTFTISSANTWTYITVAVTAPTATGGANTDNSQGIYVRFGFGSAGTAAGGTAGVWTSSGNFTQPASTVSVVGTNGATFYFTGLQLEAGSVATPFERRDIGRELIMCQRYFWLGFHSIYSQGAGTTNVMMVNYPCFMRAAPTATWTPSFSANVASFTVNSMGITGARSTLGTSGGGSGEWTGTVFLAAEL